MLLADATNKPVLAVVVSVIAGQEIIVFFFWTKDNALTVDTRAAHAGNSRDHEQFFNIYVKDE